MSILKKDSTYSPAGGGAGGLSAAALKSMSTTEENAIGRLDVQPAGGGAHRRAPPVPAVQMPVSALNSKSRYGGGGDSDGSVNGSSGGQRSSGDMEGGLDLEEQLALVQAYQSSSEVERASELAADIRELRLAIAAAEQHEAHAAQRKTEEDHIRQFVSSAAPASAHDNDGAGDARDANGEAPSLSDEEGDGDVDVSFTIEELVNLEAAHTKAPTATAPAADAEALSALRRNDLAAAEDALAAEHCEWRERCQRALNLGAQRLEGSAVPAPNVCAMLPPFDAAIELRLTGKLAQMRGGGGASGGRHSTDAGGAAGDADIDIVDLSTAAEVHYL